MHELGCRTSSEALATQQHSGGSLALRHHSSQCATGAPCIRARVRRGPARRASPPRHGSRVPGFPVVSTATGRRP